MKVASNGTAVAVGLAPRVPRISVTENFAAPELMVARVFSSGETASPNGLGARTFTSVPAGVTNRPLGRIAPGLPSSVVLTAVGRAPAGARKPRKRDWPRPAPLDGTAACTATTVPVSAPPGSLRSSPPLWHAAMLRLTADTRTNPRRITLPCSTSHLRAIARIHRYAHPQRLIATER